VVANPSFKIAQKTQISPWVIAQADRFFGCIGGAALLQNESVLT